MAKASARAEDFLGYTGKGAALYGFSSDENMRRWLVEFIRAKEKGKARDYYYAFPEIASDYDLWAFQNRWSSRKNAITNGVKSPARVVRGVRSFTESSRDEIISRRNSFVRLKERLLG